MPPAPAPALSHTVVGLLLLASSGLAQANAWLPTMISANVIWLLVLPLVVFVEGSLLRHWGWATPFKCAFLANVLSMIAALPLGIGLSILGGWLVPMSGAGGPLREAGFSREVEFIVGQVLLYGNAPAPAFGFAGGPAPGAQAALAALGFMALCWLATIAVEGWYLSRSSPLQSKAKLARRVVLMHLISYGMLAALWLPYAHWGASDEEKRAVRYCSRALSWSSRCEVIWEKFPNTLEERLADCDRRQIEKARCLRP